MAEAPAHRSHFHRGYAAAIAGCDYKGKRLAVERAVALPVLAPVPAHRQPACARPLDRHRHHIPGAAHVGDQNKVEKGVAIDGESDAPLLRASHSAIRLELALKKNKFKKKRFEDD